MPGAYRDENGAALERVVRLEDENAKLREALARKTRRGPSSALRTVLLVVVVPVALVAAAVTLLGFRRAAAPHASGSVAVGAASVAASGEVGVSVSFGSKPSFDREEAERALAAVDVRSCAGPVHYVDGLNDGVVSVVFAEDGTARDVRLSSKAFDGSAVGGCIVKKMQAVRVTPFSGGAMTVTRRFVID